jgi:hypothetical protein
LNVGDVVWLRGGERFPMTIEVTPEETPGVVNPANALRAKPVRIRKDGPDGRAGPSAAGRIAGRYSGALQYHAEWTRDEAAPSHKLHRGQRFFRDGTAEDAVRIIERRLALYPAPPDIAKKLLDDARAQTGEWTKGWPFIEAFTGDNAPNAPQRPGGRRA